MNNVVLSVLTANQLEELAVPGSSLEDFDPGLAVSAQEFAFKVLDDLGKTDWDVSVMLCDDEVIGGLNKEYRNKEGPTDVLSFEQGVEYLDGAGNKRYLAGDIVISLPAVRQNAADFAVDFTEELTRVIVHGLLHLAGHDHQTNDPTEPMLQDQEAILRRLAVSYT